MFAYTRHAARRYLTRLARTTPEYLLTATSLSPCFFAVESNPFLGGGSPRGESERRGRFLQHKRSTRSTNTTPPLLPLRQPSVTMKETLNDYPPSYNENHEQFIWLYKEVQHGKKTLRDVKKRTLYATKTVAMRGKGGRKGTVARSTGIRGREE
ncbi:uncharacterized protein LOC143148770 [Ptiloglossa arizonensis]|uniref:uncharacterized protein LOC143148770 n=1 Tax=Ptiloglossa arizonensis TaxID=3350558 RepID=UPI003F9FA417